MRARRVGRYLLGAVVLLAYRYEKLVAELQRVGLRVEASTFNPEAEAYMVVAGCG